MLNQQQQKANHLTSARRLGRMATVAWRRDLLPAVVQSLAGQLDELRLYAGDCEVPASVRRLSWVQVVQGANVGDRGRWHGADETASYVFCLDDDILYPADYTENLVKLLLQYQHAVVAGVHARSFLHATPQNYFDDSKMLHFSKSLAAPQAVHVLGTGTLAYHTDLIRFAQGDFDEANVADLIVATSLERRGIPRIAMAREANWLRQLPVKESLYGQREKYAELQNQLTSSIAWRVPPMNAEVF